MGLVLHDPPFEEWVRHMFDHPTASPAWHLDIGADRAIVSPTLALSHVRRLFKESGTVLTAYSDAQVNDGLWFLLEGSASFRWLHDVSVSPQLRSACLREITELFRQVFLPRCTPHLSIVEEYDAGPLNSACYMWWDLFPFHGKPHVPEQGEPDLTCLTVMEETLALPSIACQESALHGLGHWALHYPAPCARAVDRFLASHAALRPELVRYAQSARRGAVL